MKLGPGELVIDL